MSWWLVTTCEPGVHAVAHAVVAIEADDEDAAAREGLVALSEEFSDESCGQCEMPIAGHVNVVPFVATRYVVRARPEREEGSE